MAKQNETIVVDYEKGEVVIIKHPVTRDVERMLTEGYNYSLGAINWMTMDSIKIKRIPAVKW